MEKVKGKVLVACRVHPILTEGLAGLGYQIDEQEKVTQEEARAVLGDYVGVITSTRLLFDKAMLGAGGQLRWIGRMGSGMEIIDTDYAATQGIQCFSSPEGNCNAVGEHALGMLLALANNIVVSMEELQQGLWRREENRGWELEGKTLGIIGYGHAGSSFAAKLRGFNMRILAYDKYHPEKVTGAVHRCDTLSELWEQADIVSFHVPLQEDTFHYFDHDFCMSMRKPFVLINTSRGQVVATDAIIEGLRSGKVKGVCLDVYEEESPFGDEVYRVKMEALLKFRNVIATPHIAGYSHEALYKMSAVLLARISEH